ncbi:MAG TPA: response regulator [Syntrophorhabdaceae bacterium]|nr:response regulator [Syntrophorhabdaceae bacterium]
MTKNDEDFRILVVDDSRELREILEEYLRGEGDVVEGAQNGREALDKHKERFYDLIITDLNMPEMTGMDLIKTVKGENEITEFIIVTGYASMDTAVEAVKIGAFDYIVKPFRMEELRVVVRNARDKVKLKKLNARLLETLKGFYNEIGRYRPRTQDNAESGARSNGEPKEVASGPLGDTEKIVKEINDLGKLGKGRLLID